MARATDLNRKHKSGISYARAVLERGRGEHGRTDDARRNAAS